MNCEKKTLNMANMAEEKVKCHEIDRVQGLYGVHYFRLEFPIHNNTFYTLE